jgi:transketolase
MTVLAPADANEMRRMMPLTVEHPGPIYIRIAKGGDPIVTNDTPFEIGKAFPMREGYDALIVSTGVMLKRALDAAELLRAEGLEASVLHVPTVKPLDQAAILDYASRVPAIVTVEEHSIIGGLGSAVAELLAEANFSAAKRFKRIGIPDCFPDQYGSQDSLLARYGITASNIAGAVRQLTHTKTKESYQTKSWAD